MSDKSFDAKKALEVIVAFNGEKDYFELLNIILNKMMEMANADAGTLYVLEDDRLHFRITKNKTLNTFQGAQDEIGLPPIVLDGKNIENISAYCAIKNEIVSVDDVYESSEFNFAGPKNYDKITGYRTKSMLVFPLTSISAKNIPSVIGVIQLINAVDKKTGEIISFDDACDSGILLAISKIAGSTLANLLFSQEISELLDSFVRVMTTAIDERSVYNVNHTNNVARLCDAFSIYLSEKFPSNDQYYFDPRRRDQLVMAALLHDIGKIITPLSVMDKIDRLGDKLEIIRYKFDIKNYQLEAEKARGAISDEQYEEQKSLLQDALSLIETANDAGYLDDDKIEKIKALSEITYKDRKGSIATILTESDLASLSVRKGTLTEEERQIMQEHVSITGRLLDSMKFNKYYSSVPEWARKHHEFLDGSGYPCGLKGSEVPVEVCILSITDIYDALVASDRPYKRAMPKERAFGILIEMADMGKLDKNLVELFIESGVCENSGK